MSEKKKKEENTEQKEKVVTKYDLKMQRRKEEREKAKKQERFTMAAGIVIVIALVCLVASFPIRTYLAVNESYVKINGEDVTRVEFDMNYHLSMAEYVNQYGAYMSYFGFDPSGDISTQMYSDTLSYKDWFEQEAVKKITQNKALKAQAEAEGFVYDTAEEYAEFEEGIKKAAADSGVSEREYIQEQYGPYATKSRIAKYIKESIYLNAYYEKVVEEKKPGEEELLAHYKEDPDLYDSVDYRLETISASFAAEATEDEIAKAMEKAKQSAESTDATGAELVEHGTWNTTNSSIRSWLFDSARKAGDTTVIESADNYCYYVVAFKQRYLDETPTVDARVLITSTEDGQALLDEWKNGEATEESFAELCKAHSEDTSAAEGGLYETLSKTYMDSGLADWLFDSARQAGDTAALAGEDGSTYVFYFVKKNLAEWQIDAETKLVNDIMQQYLEDIQKDVVVEDPKGHLNYLKIQAQEEAAAAAGAGTGDTANAGDAADAENGTADAATVPSEAGN